MSVAQQPLGERRIEAAGHRVLVVPAAAGEEAPDLDVGVPVTHTGVVRWNTPEQSAQASVTVYVGGAPGVGTLNGAAWHDADFDNTRGAGERPLAGWSVELYRDGQPLHTALTGADGNYRILGVEPILGRTFSPEEGQPGNDKVARDEWGYGFAGAVVNTSGNWFYGVLLTQSWRAVDPDALPAGSSDTNPIGIAPILNFQLGGGWYVGNGDMVLNYDWDSNEFYIPIGVRFGKVIPGGSGSWNLYVEYQTSLVYEDYPGAAKDSSWRFNVTRTLPAGF